MIILSWLFTICYFITTMSADDMFKPENPLNLNDSLFSGLTDNVQCMIVNKLNILIFLNCRLNFTSHSLLVLHMNIRSLQKYIAVFFVEKKKFFFFSFFVPLFRRRQLSRTGFPKLCAAAH